MMDYWARSATAAILGVALLAAPAAADGPVNWTSFYLGAHGGYGWGTWNGPLSYDDHDPTWPQPQYAFDSAAKSIEGDNWLGGLQIGFNHQVGSLVWGLEADVAWTGIEGKGSFLPYPNNADSPVWAIESRLDMLGTARGRLGFASGPLLLYATGGLAWGNAQSSIEPVYTGGYVAAHGTAERTHVGYAVGGGLEWMLGRNWTVRAEYLFVDLGEQDYGYVGKTTGGGAVYDTDHHHADLELHTVRVGVNYQLR